MNKLTFNKHYHKTLNYINKNSASILTGLGIVGVATTTVLGIKATPKAQLILEEKEEYKFEHYGEPLTKFEKALAVTPVYLPTILMGVATASCIFGANYINKQQQAILASAYTYLNANFNEYKEKVKEIYGEDADEKVKIEIAKDRLANIEIDDINLIEKKTFYDEFSGRYFKMSFYDLQEIMYKVNRDYSCFGQLSLNNLYEYLGMEPSPSGDLLGWNSAKDWECVGYSWIDIRWEKMDMPDDFECYAIRFNIDPNDDWYEW